jgi:hypothetical protein
MILGIGSQYHICSLKSCDWITFFGQWLEGGLSVPERGLRGLHPELVSLGKLGNLDVTRVCVGDPVQTYLSPQSETSQHIQLETVPLSRLVPVRVMPHGEAHARLSGS